MGKAAYATNCASCHGNNVDDGEFAPPLKGVEFRQRWGGKSLDVLFTDISTRMPTSAPGSLSEATNAPGARVPPAAERLPRRRRSAVSRSTAPFQSDAAVVWRRPERRIDGRHQRASPAETIQSARQVHRRHRCDAGQPAGERMAADGGGPTTGWASAR